MAEKTMNLNDLMRRIPKVDAVQAAPRYATLVAGYSKPEADHYLAWVLDELRNEARGGKELPEKGAVDVVLERLAEELRWHRHRRKQGAVNATGVVLHTGLGRAYLDETVRKRVVECAGYTNLEVDVHSGQRNFREEYLADLLCILTGAEAATIVNNNAAATLLVINTFAMGKEVVVSRGELVEIGGSFRVPEVMGRALAKLVEVGTTNKTHLKDYEKAIRAETGLLLKVHTSNYVIEGFTKSVSNEELVELGAKHKVAVCEDLGSGALYDPLEFGMDGEPLVADSLKSGLDALCFSGDKLVGGPQGGIILGKKAAIQAIRSNPLFRALRVDKLTLAAMEATIEAYLSAKPASRATASGRMMAEELKHLEARGKKLCEGLKKAPVDVELVETTVQPGSGSLPGQKIESRGLSVHSKTHAVDRLAGALRQHEPPVFSRIESDRVILDLRTVQPEQDAVLAAALQRVDELVKLI